MNIAYPFHIDNHRHIANVAQEKYIEQLMEQLLFTAPGERVNRPDFGSGLTKMIFAPGNNELATANEFLIKGVLQQWLGDLIIVQNVFITLQEEKVFITIQYIIKKNQQSRTVKFTTSNSQV